MTDHTIRLATGPVSWGVDFADAPGNPPWEHVLDAIAGTGLGALELGPVGYLPEDGDVLRGALAQRSLDVVGSFVFEDLHDPAQHDAIRAVAARAASAIVAAGGRVLVIIDRVSDERAATAGRSEAARRLTGDEWRTMLAFVEELGDLARSHGLDPVLHPHVGSYVEFADELERFATDSDMQLCLDTGHAAIAGIDPVDALTRYGARLGHLHLKDADGDVLARVRSEGLGFWDAIEASVFCPLGDGVVDFAAVRRALDEVGYTGFATIEQDRVPGSGAPEDDIMRSVEVLAGAGFAHASAQVL